MPKDLLIGVDLGSSGTKVTLMRASGQIVAIASSPTALHSDQPGWAEADTQEWWSGTVAAVREVMATSRSSRDEVAAIATTGMVPAVVVLDADGQPLRRGILQNDARAVAQIEQLGSRLTGVDLVALTGSALSQQSVAPTLMWLAEHEPAVWAKAAWVVGSYDWLAMRMGAWPHVERNWALESGLYRLDGGVMDEVVAATGMDLPPMLEPVSSGTGVGFLDAAAAAELDLAAGTPIIVGGADHVLSAFAAGLTDQGDVLVKLGGAGDILAVSDTPLVDERLYLDAHPAPGKWLPNGCMATSGSLLRWEQHLLGDPALIELDALADASAPAQLITLPFFLGEKTPMHDPELRGAVVGLHLGTTRGDLHRSFLESIAYGFRHHFDVFADLGVTLRRPRVTNGGSKSAVFKQILADVLGTDLTPVLDHPGASLGAAIAAGVGTGLVPDWGFAAGLLTMGETIEPRPANRAIYDERYGQYRELIDTLTPVSHALARSTA